MPRPQRPIDPSEGPIAEFAAELRGVRDRAGRPTYREMARKVHRSQTSLSEAAGGRIVPTWETTEAFLRACDVDDLPSWRRRWEQCRQIDEPSVARPFWRRRRMVVAISGAAIVCGLAAALALVLIDDQPEDGRSSRAASSTRSVVTAGADPEDTGCANDDDVSTVDAREVLLDGMPVGVVELRYSPRCGASWPRFTPADPRYVTITKPGPITAELTVIAHDQRHTHASFSAPYAGLPVFGNLIDSTRACVHAEVYLHGPGWRTDTGRTACFRGTSAIR